jgi:uncharacterized protein (TIGR02117 family)
MAAKILIKGKLLRILKAAIYLLVLAVFLYFFFAFVFSYLPTHPPQQDCEAGQKIFVATNGVHVDIILRADQVDPGFIHELDFPANARYISFGWGDKNFYIHTPEWSDLTFTVAFKALFLRSETAMHVNYYSREQSWWHPVCLCEEQLQQLFLYIRNSFAIAPDGKINQLDFEGYTDFDSFYEAKGAFTLFNTCNVWANKGLKSIEIKTSVWSPFDFGVLFHVKRLENESCSN